MSEFTITTVAIALLASLILTPLVRRMAHQLKVLDMPDAARKLHRKPTALGGGVAVALSSILAASISLLRVNANSIPVSTVHLVPIALSAIAMLLVGLLDDIVVLRSRQKLLGQITASLVFVYYGTSVSSFSIGGFDFELGIFAVPLTVAWLLATTNAVNLLDGADGFASTIGIAILIPIAFVTATRGQYEEAIIAMAVIGGLLGFLAYNLPPSTIFLGDAGSHFVGFLIGALALTTNIKQATSIALIPTLALLTIPLVDTAAAIARRVLTKRGLAIADRGHLHHSLSQRGFGPRGLLLGVAGLSAISGYGAARSVLTGNQWWGIGGAMVVVAILIGSRTFLVNELRLVGSRCKHFLHSLVARSPEADPNFTHQRVGLGDSEMCQGVWDEMVAFAQSHELSNLRLDLYGAWMRDGSDVLWERSATRKSVNNWSTTMPVQAFGRDLGKIQIAGEVSDRESVRLMLNRLAALLEALEPRLDALFQDTSLSAPREQRASVLFINRSYWPDCEATGQLLTQLCESLSERFDVSVLAGQPNYNPQNKDYKRSGTQTRNHVEIRRVTHTQYDKKSMLGRGTNLLSFLGTASVAALFGKRHDIVVVETDPFLLALTGWLIKRVRDCQLVIYMQDVYPDVAVCIGKVREGLLTRTIRFLLSRAYRAADQIVVLGRDMEVRLITHGVDKSKIACIPNWTDTQKVYPIKLDNDFRRENGVTDKFVVMHSGNMGMTQCLENLIEVAERLQHRADIVFMMVGGGAAESSLRELVAAKELTNIRFLPYQPHESLALSLSAADLHIVSMDPRLRGCLVPSKLYGIFASGTPVLAWVPRRSEIHRMIRRERVGIAVDAGDINGAVGMILKCVERTVDLEQMGATARRLAETHYDSGHSIGKFDRMLTGLQHRRIDARHPQPPSPKKEELEAAEA